MHNLKEIRKDYKAFAKSLENRFINIDIINLQKLDEKNRELIRKKELLENQKKDISRSQDKDLFQKSKEISIELDKISQNQKKTKFELDNILSNIPKVPNQDFFEAIRV